MNVNYIKCHEYSMFSSFLNPVIVALS